MKFFNLKYAAVAAAFLALSFTSCKNDTEDNVNPADEISITAPAENAVVNAGQTVTITGTIKGKKEIHGYKITVRQKSDNALLYSKNMHSHGASIAINETWTIDTVARHKEVEMEIVATLDHEGNTLSKKITLHAMPAGKTNFATITVTAPTEGGMVTGNQTMNITGSINGLVTIHGYTLNIRQKSNGAIIHTKDVHEHKAIIPIAETWAVPAVTGHTEYELEIVAALDHDGNTVTKKVNFHAMP